jgi:hypothetical protein
MNFFRKSSHRSPLPEGNSNSKRRTTRSSGGASNGGVTSSDGKSTVYRVAIPPGTTPGSEFQVQTGSKIVRVCCPPNCKPGRLLLISVPIDPLPKAGIEQNEHRPMGRSESPNEPVERRDDGALMDTKPNGARSEKQFPVTLEEQTLTVTSPINTRSGTQDRVMPPQPQVQPPIPSTSVHSTPPTSRTAPNRSTEDVEASPLFEVLVPKGVKPGKSFKVLAGG